jgi:hypothetical protein
MGSASNTHAGNYYYVPGRKNHKIIKWSSTTDRQSIGEAVCAARPSCKWNLDSSENSTAQNNYSNRFAYDSLYQLFHLVISSQTRYRFRDQPSRKMWRSLLDRKGGFLVRDHLMWLVWVAGLDINRNNIGVNV